MKVFQIILIIAVILIANFWTYFLLKQDINSQIYSIVRNAILSIEYEKVGGKDIYYKINTINKEQIKAYIDQYELQNGEIKVDTTSSDDNNIQANKKWSDRVLTKDQLEKIYEGTYVLWNPDAEITFIEYSDLECPFCKRLHVSWTIDKVLSYYSWKVNFRFKHFPLSFHENAQKEAEAAECVGELWWSEKFYTYINEIFKRTKSNWKGFPLSWLRPLAEELWIDWEKFQQCLDSWKYAEKVRANMQEWIDLFKVSGTPGNILINNKTWEWDKLPWAYPFEAFRNKIDNLLK